MNYKIVIDAGHGGTDPGAVGNGIIEKDINLQISQYMKKRFDELGVPSSMTRTGDETLTPEERTKRAKSFYGNGNDVILLSNHINAGGGDGFEIVYALRNNDTLAAKISDEMSKTGQNVRKYYQRRSTTDPSKDYYFIIRDTANMQSNLVEYGFLDSTKDDVNQLKNNWQEMAEAVVKATMNYIGKPYTKPRPEEENPTSPGNYVVKKGDSLWSISREFGISVDELKNANNLTNNLLTIGQVLTIPGVTSSEEQIHTVKAGDTLYSIALKYGTTVDIIKDLNNLTSNNLSIGQKLLIFKETPTAENKTYTVVAGDSLYAIALRYGTTVEAIKKLNNLTTNLLSIGQVLKIPETENTNEIIYTVVPRDSLYSIAARYNTTVNKLRSDNNLTTDVLSIGQKLIIR